MWIRDRFTVIIANVGYQTAYLVNAILMAVLILPWTLFVIKRNPEDKGLKPFGFKEDAADAAESVAEAGMPAKAALKTAAFWIVFFGVALTALGMGFSNNQAGIAKEFMANTDMAERCLLYTSFLRRMTGWCSECISRVMRGTAPTW